MIRIFKIFNGSQDSALHPNLIHFFVLNWNLTNRDGPAQESKRTVIPDGLKMYKGSFATSMSKEFVDFLFSNSISRSFYRWLNGSKCPEKHYWTTLIRNVQLNARGSFPSVCLDFYEYRGRTKMWASRFQIWLWDKIYKCKGKIVNLSCVYGIEDLRQLIKRPELNAHKVCEEFEPLTTFCLEQWY